MATRRRFVGASTCCLLAVPLLTHAQPQPTRKWRIGVIGRQPVESSPETARLWNIFLQAMRERGYVEGGNVVFELRYHEGRPERFPELVADLVRLKVDVLIVGPAPGVRAAMEATRTIPIIMSGTSDPVRAGLVASLGRPGGNVTGIADYEIDLIPKRLELLKSAAPGTRRVGYLLGNFSGFDNAKLTTLGKEQDAAARGLGMTLLRIHMNTPQDLEMALAALRREHPDALMLSPNPANFLLRKELAEFALLQHLPTVAATREHAAAGIMISYGPSTAELLRKIADFVDRVLKGASPADLPVEQPTKFDLSINLKTARALGITIPQAVLLRADEVIQ